MIGFIKKLFRKPDRAPHCSEALDKLDKLRRDGLKEIDVRIGTELLSAIMQDSAQLMALVLHNTPKAENYLRFVFVDDDKPEYSFNVIIQKNGKKLPPA